MIQLTYQEQKIINQKWSIGILILLSNNKKHSYRSIKHTGIPNSTLSLRLNELVKNKYIEKFIYGSISKPHYTEYKITSFGLDYINNMFTNNIH